MNHKLLWMIAFAVVVAASPYATSFAFAQEQKVDDRVIETPEERTARMFRTFDLIDYTRAGGVIIVNFREDVTKDEAAAILRAMGLSIREGERCWSKGFTYENPQTTKGQPNPIRCVSTGEIWNEELKSAYVNVPVRQEREYAERLIQNPRVVWVEPELLETAAGEVGGATTETPAERTARMFRAFDDSSSYRAGAVIVNFTPGIAKETARTVLARLNLTMETETMCGPEEAGPEGPTNGRSNCQTAEKWIENLSAAVAAVPAGAERAYAARLIAEPEVVWVEPDMIATATGEQPAGQMSSKDARAKQNLVLYVAASAITVVILAFFMRRKKPTT